MPPSPEKNATASSRKSFPLNLVLIAVVIVLALVVVGMNKERIMTLVQKGGVSIGASGDSYKAVFLTNGQVYFGKVALGSKQYTNLTNVFYLQVKQPLQGENNEAAPLKPELNLVKLGTELHGPTDAMMINNDQILFLEDLKGDSQVVKGIGDYYAKNK